MVKKLLAIILAFTFAASLVSCSKDVSTSGDDISPTGSVTSSQAEEPSPAVTPASREAFVFPDTQKRPVAVMIDNEGTRSLPQGGMNQAQVIYEILVEGGETRLMPVFWGTEPEKIGPVRSSRHYFLDYVLEHDAIYVHYGWSPQAKSDISKLKINNINGVSSGGSIFWDLTNDKNNWQDSYTSMEKIYGYVSKVKYRTESEIEAVFKYYSDFKALSSGEPAKKVSIRYSSSYTCGFEYDEDKKVYLRYRKGKPQMERNTGEQLEAVNIIIQFNTTYGIKGDDKGRQEVVTTGSGNGYFITGGSVVKINWTKKSRSAPTVYTYENGESIKLNPGPTWVQVVPTSGKVTFE